MPGSKGLRFCLEVIAVPSSSFKVNLAALPEKALLANVFGAGGFLMLCGPFRGGFDAFRPSETLSES